MQIGRAAEIPAETSSRPDPVGATPSAQSVLATDRDTVTYGQDRVTDRRHR
jgi:hypothetical protein